MNNEPQNKREGSRHINLRNMYCRPKFMFLVLKKMYLLMLIAYKSSTIIVDEQLCYFSQAS